MKQLFSISIIFCLFVYLSCNKSENNASSASGQDSLSQNLDAKSQAQDKEATKIEKDFIWASCYPNEKRFDGKQRLMRSEADFKTVTLIEKLKEYELNGKHKVYVIFTSFVLSGLEGEIDQSHASAATISVAKFIWNVDKWELEKFVGNWKESIGAWGQGPEWTFKTQDGREIFGMKWMYGNHGNFEEYNEFYDVETLEKVKLQKNKNSAQVNINAIKTQLSNFRSNQFNNAFSKTECGSVYTFSKGYFNYFKIEIEMGGIEYLFYNGRLGYAGEYYDSETIGEKGAFIDNEGNIIHCEQDITTQDQGNQRNKRSKIDCTKEIIDIVKKAEKFWQLYQESNLKKFDGGC